METKEFLRRVEGYRLNPYKDSKGLLTVGVGHLLERPYTPEEVEDLLERDLKDITLSLERLPYWSDLTPARQCVLTSLAFNVGIGGFWKFKNMRAALEAKDYEKAAEELRDSNRSREDIAPWRSGLEYQMMKTGNWQED